MRGIPIQPALVALMIGASTTSVASTVYGNPNIILSPDELDVSGLVDASADISSLTFRGCGSNPPMTTVTIGEILELDGSLSFDPPPGTWCQVKAQIDELCIDDGTLSCSAHGPEWGQIGAPVFVDGSEGDDTMIVHLQK